MHPRSKNTVALSSALLGIGCLISLVSALDNGLARTPPMGWLAWERFTCETDCVKYPNDCISSQLFKQQADQIISRGYNNLGYEYVNIDDCWSEKERDSTNEKLVADKLRFPYGIKELSDYMHSRGLKLGIYGDCGTKTCAEYPAQLKSETNLEDNYFELDAKTFEEWQVDSFKFDGCFIDSSKAESICPRMAAALKAARPTLLICEWPFYMIRDLHAEPNYTLAQESCNAWRYYEDVMDDWLSVLSIVDFTVKMQDTIVKYHGPGNWFDPDQLVIGNFALSLDQARAQMALWCLWSAPLYMSNDLRFIDTQMETVLQNKKLIDVDQDDLGVFGLLVGQEDGNKIQAFVKPVEPIKNGCPSFVIVYLNRNTLGNKKKVSFEVRDLLSKPSQAIDMAAKRHQERFERTRYKLGGDFNAEECKRRISRAMTKNPSSLRGELVMTPGGKQLAIPLEEQQINYKVTDLFGDQADSHVGLNSYLELYVNPSGVRVVKLEEIEGAVINAVTSGSRGS